MIGNGSDILIERALSTTKSLIFSREQLSDNDVESLLFQIESLLTDAGKDDIETDASNENVNSANNLSNEIFDLSVVLGKIKHASQLVLSGCFTASDGDKPECVMTGAISDYANEAYEMLRKIENTYF